MKDSMTMTPSVVNSSLPANAFVPAKGTDFNLHSQVTVGGEETWIWTSCGPTFSDRYSSNDAFISQEAAVDAAVTVLTTACNDAFDFLSLEDVATDIDMALADSSPYQCGVHFHYAPTQTVKAFTGMAYVKRQVRSPGGGVKVILVSIIQLRATLMLSMLLPMRSTPFIACVSTVP